MDQRTGRSTAALPVIGDPYYLELKKEDSTSARCRGILVARGEGTSILGVPPEAVGEGSHGSAGPTPVAFISVMNAALLTTKPKDWKETLALRPWPTIETLMDAFNEMEVAVPQVSTSSDGGNGPRVRVEANGGGRGMKNVPIGLRRILERAKGSLREREDQDDEEEESEEPEEDEEEEESEAPRSSKSKPTPKKKKVKEEEKKAPLGDMDEMLAAALASGEIELKDVLLYRLLLGKGEQEKKKKKKAREGSSDEELEDDSHGGLKGLRGFGDVDVLKEKREKYPLRHVRHWKEELMGEMGVDEGQPFSVRDWRRRQNFGPFKSMNRAIEMDVEIFNRLEAALKDKPISRHKVALALVQVAQNIKAKKQMTLDQGDWTQAWELTGLKDPCSRKDFVGTAEESLRVARHLTARAELLKRRQELIQTRPMHPSSPNWTGGGAEQEEKEADEGADASSGGGGKPKGPKGKGKNGK